jgi:hypothetical protein
MREAIPCALGEGILYPYAGVIASELALELVVGQVPWVVVEQDAEDGALIEVGHRRDASAG